MASGRDQAFAEALIIMNPHSETDPLEREFQELLRDDPGFTEKMRACGEYHKILEKQISLDGHDETRHPFQSFRDYRIIREIGRGGMGIVYEAWQESLGRRIALKIISPGLLPNSKAPQSGRNGISSGRV